MGRFHLPEAENFRLLWKELRAEQYRHASGSGYEITTPRDTWIEYMSPIGKLRQSWYILVRNVVYGGKTDTSELDEFLAIWQSYRDRWLRAGGYFLTKSNNPRMREQPPWRTRSDSHGRKRANARKPRIHALRKKIATMKSNLDSVIEQEELGALPLALLCYSGAITPGRQITRHGRQSIQSHHPVPRLVRGMHKSPDVIGWLAPLFGFWVAERVQKTVQFFWSGGTLKSRLNYLRRNLQGSHKTGSWLYKSEDGIIARL